MPRRDYSGRTVIVTGAGGGLGAALARRFGRAGARIGGLDRDAATLSILSAELRERNVRHATATCDLTDEGATQNAVSALEEALGPPSLLINNAGITHLRNFRPGEESAVRRVVEVNLFGSVHATGACLPSLRAERGQIIVISSVAGYAPLLGRSGYCASKHALHGFFETLRAELRDDGVGVLMVCPSFIATGLRDGFQSTESAPGGQQTVGRDDRPEDVAERIYRAARADRRFLTTGRVGALSFWLRRLAPRLYETLMVRSIRDET